MIFIVCEYDFCLFSWILLTAHDKGIQQKIKAFLDETWCLSYALSVSLLGKLLCMRLVDPTHETRGKSHNAWDLVGMPKLPSTVWY